MSGSSTGKSLVFTCFGESHGECIGAVVDGCPAGLPLTVEDIQKEIDRRRPGLSIISTRRREDDKVEILSGVYGEYTTGAPICMIARNMDTRSIDYKQIHSKPRPSHADYAAYLKYGGFNDYRGGGRFSGRITLAYVMAGAIAKKLLRKIGVEVLAHVIRIGKVEVKGDVAYEDIRNNVYDNAVRCAVPDVTSKFEREILNAKAEGDSVGGVIEAIALNVPKGIGEPIFDSLDSDIGKMLFNIPSVKGVEFGLGFRSSSLRGSQNNDPYALKEGEVVTLSNNAGGILGGISIGMPIIVRIAFKPPSSIKRKQKTIDLQSMREAEIEIEGRHDPCIVPRAVPVVESCVSLVLADHAIRSNKISRIL